MLTANKITEPLKIQRYAALKLVISAVLRDLRPRDYSTKPYQHIMSADGAGTYMGRWWLLNPYDRKTHKPKIWWLPWSFRIHHIK